MNPGWCVFGRLQCFPIRRRPADLEIAEFHHASPEFIAAIPIIPFCFASFQREIKIDRFTHVIGTCPLVLPVVFMTAVAAAQQRFRVTQPLTVKPDSAVGMNQSHVDSRVFV